MDTQYLIPPRILIIDDDELISASLRILLRSEGFSVFRTKDQSEVIDLITNHKVDLVFVDLMMPNRIGFSVLKEIKDNQQTRHIPVIILTNLGHMDYINAGMDMGAADYLLKSNIDTDDVVKIAKKYLITHNARQNLRMS